MDTEHMNVHDKIDILADVIEYDSKNLKKTYKQSFVNWIWWMEGNTRVHFTRNKESRVMK